MDSAIEIEFGGHVFLAEARRALIWPAQQTLIVADLHLGKAVDFSPRGTLLPPYEMNDTVERLGALISNYAPRRIIALGDSFHRKNSPARLLIEEQALLDAVIARVEEWVFIEGNHDAESFAGGKWSAVDAVAEHGLLFCHQPPKSAREPVIFGHYHPKFMRHHRQAGHIAKPCFIWNERMMILPAFGTYTGGLDIASPPVRKYFSGPYNVALAETYPKPVLLQL